MHVDGYIAVVAHTVHVGLQVQVMIDGLTRTPLVLTPLPTPTSSLPLCALRLGPRQASDVKGDLAAAYGAAFTAAKVAAGLIRPGNTNTQVTTAIKKVTEAYGVASICGTIMHQVNHKMTLKTHRKMGLERETKIKLKPGADLTPPTSVSPHLICFLRRTR